MTAVIAVALLGGAGACARFLLDGAVARRLGRAFPFGTLAVNVAGAFLFGLLVGLALGAGGERLLGTGLLGGFTTFSTWAFESHRLAEDGRSRLAALNFLVSALLGLAAVWLGRRSGATL